MNLKYEIVRYEPKYKEQVTELQRHSWSSSLRLNAAYLEWKHEQNPYVKEPLIYLGLYAGKVVGMRGMSGAKWQIGPPAQTFLGLKADDLVIVPEHRNRGLFTQIMRAALDDLAKQGHTYVFSLTAGPVTLLGSLAMGWRSIGSMQTVFRRTEHRISRLRVRRWASRLPLVWRFADKLPLLYSAEERNPFHLFDRNSARRQRSVNRWVSADRVPRPEAMAELIERIGSDGRIRHVRDRQYFAWRFQNPLHAYRFLFWEETNLEGYLVLQKSISTLSNRERVRIADWEATSPQIGEELLRTAIQLGNFNDCGIWSATLPAGTRTLLQDTGFNPLLNEAEGMDRYRSSVLVRPVRDEMLKTEWTLVNRRLLDLANWDLRMLYAT